MIDVTKAGVALCLLLIASSVSAGPIDWAKRHKLTLGSAALLSVVETEEAKSTLYDEKICPTCQDNGFFGPHPSHAQVIGASVIIVTAMTAVNLLADKYHPDKGGNVFVHALTTIPLMIGGGADVYDNYHIILPARSTHGDKASRYAAYHSRQ